MNGSAVFVDTSILVKWMTGSQEMRACISRRVSSYDVCVSGEVCKKEFVHTFLGAVKYLVLRLEEGMTPVDLNHYLANNPQNTDKVKLARQILANHAFRTSQGRTYFKAQSRLIAHLRYFLNQGAELVADALVDKFEDSIDCSAANSKVEYKGKRISLGASDCGQAQATCGVCQFLKSSKAKLLAIRKWLKGAPPFPVSTQLTGAKDFLDEIIGYYASAEAYKPCKTQGDLLISLESVPYQVMYTCNYKESTHYCRILGQTMIYRDPFKPRDDVVCTPQESEEQWRSRFDWPNY